MYRRFNLLVSKDKHDTDEEEHLCQKKSISEEEEHDTDEVIATTLAHDKCKIYLP
jgi:hypothetical protein